MSWVDLVCLGVIIIGFVFFVYGANYFDANIGWAGVCIFVGGILARIIFYIYDELKKKGSVQNS